MSWKAREGSSDGSRIAWMSDLPRFFINFNQREIDEVQVVKKEGGRSWGTIVLQALNVMEDSRPVGRPHTKTPEVHPEE